MLLRYNSITELHSGILEWMNFKSFLSEVSEHFHCEGTQPQL